MRYFSLHNGVELFPTWVVGKAYAVSDRAQYNGTLYKYIQAHTLQTDWTPDATPALWAVVRIDEYPEWVQPAGAHDAYKHRILQDYIVLIVETTY